MMKEYHLSTLFDAWPLEELLSALNALMGWCQRHLPDCTDITLREIWKPVPDPHYRVDIVIRYHRGSHWIEQKLLILDGEVVDGKTFHARYREFYSEKL